MYREHLRATLLLAGLVRAYADDDSVRLVGRAGTSLLPALDICRERCMYSKPVDTSRRPC